MPGSSGRPGKAVAASPSGWGRIVAAVLATLAWMLCSSMLIILNKHLYRMGFKFPFLVTGMGQVFSAAGGYALVRAGFLPLRPPPSLGFAATNLAPIWASSTATMFFGNVSYLYLSVAFIQILKAFTPALTLLLCVLARLERFQWPVLASVMLIATGTASAVLVESGTPSFQPLGLMAFMVSSATEAGRVVGAEVLLGAQRYNSAEALLYISGPTAALLGLGALIWERDEIMRVGPALFLAEPLAFFAAFFMSFLVNLTCFAAIQTTSSLTFKAGGYCVSVVGFAMYSTLKMRVQRQPHAARLAGEPGKQQ